jgi:hypothetical protein
MSTTWMRFIRRRGAGSRRGQVKAGSVPAPRRSLGSRIDAPRSEKAIVSALVAVALPAWRMSFPWTWPGPPHPRFREHADRHRATRSRPDANNVVSLAALLRMPAPDHVDRAGQAGASQPGRGRSRIPRCASGVRPDLPYTSASRDGIQSVRCSSHPSRRARSPARRDTRRLRRARSRSLRGRSLRFGPRAATRHRSGRDATPRRGAHRAPPGRPRASEGMRWYFASFSPRSYAAVLGLKTSTSAVGLIDRHPAVGVELGARADHADVGVGHESGLEHPDAQIRGVNPTALAAQLQVERRAHVRADRRVLGRAVRHRVDLAIEELVADVRAVLEREVLAVRVAMEPDRRAHGRRC